jgi:hypothetical protein
LCVSCLTSLLIHLSQCSAPLTIVRISEKKHFHWSGHILASNKILKIICGRDSLRFGCPKEVLHHRVGIISEGDFDGTIEAMDIPRFPVSIPQRINALICVLLIVRCSLIGLMLLHERDQFLGRPPFGLEVIIIRGRCSSIHHEVDGRTSSQNVSTRYDSLSATKPF